jgi:hypothetical protein
VPLRLATILLLALAAPAAACPPSVRLAGDEALAHSIGDVLRARGIALAPSGCRVIEARVERRGDAIAVTIDGETERIVREATTAATVIESFARPDVDAPLLAVRPVPIEREPVAITVEPAIAPPPGARSVPHGWQVFTGFEMGFASDGAPWSGFHVGACKMLGPICLAARVRGSTRVTGEPAEQHGVELLAGIDIPFRARGWLISPGFGFGPSTMATLDEDSRYVRTDGLRAGVHVTVSVPLTERFALDIGLAASLLQQLGLEEAGMFGNGMPLTPDASLPSEPWGFARFGVGVRYGRR